MTVKIEIQKCLRCNYEWYPRSPQKPTVCAKCRSKYWDKPYVRRVKEKTVEPKIAETVEKRFIFGAQG